MSDLLDNAKRLESDYKAQIEKWEKFETLREEDLQEAQDALKNYSEKLALIQKQIALLK